MSLKKKNGVNWLLKFIHSCILPWYRHSECQIYCLVFSDSNTFFDLTTFSLRSVFLSKKKKDICQKFAKRVDVSFFSNKKTNKHIWKMKVSKCEFSSPRWQFTFLFFQKFSWFCPSSVFSFFFLSDQNPETKNKSLKISWQFLKNFFFSSSK